MPRISVFYGIVIWMYYDDHNPPHFHARYGEYEVTVAITTLSVLNGWLPARALRLVGEWAGAHAAELVDDWERARAGQPLVPIDPLR